VTADCPADDTRRIRRELDATRARLDESKEAIRAIVGGEVDGLMVVGPDGRPVFTLLASQEPYRLLIEQMSESALTLSREGIILYANPTLARLLQAPLERVIGAALRTFVSPEDLPVLDGLVEEAWNGSSRGEMDVRAADGSLIPMRLGLSRLRLGATTLVCVVATDLTEKKKKVKWRRRHSDLEKCVEERTADLATARLAALNMMEDAVAARRKAETAHRDLQEEMTVRRRTEAELANAAAEWSATFDAISDAICLMDLEGRILRCNTAAGTLFGMDLEDIVGRTCSQLFHGKDMHPPDCPLFSMQETGARASNTFQYGNLWIHDIVYPQKDANGQIVSVVHILSDITAQRELEQQLLQSQKMEVVGNLAGGIAHDFNNILTSVMANLDLIGAEGHIDPRAGEYLLEARNELDRAATLTSHLLAFSRRQTLRPVNADLNQVVSTMGRMLRRLLGEQIILEIRLADEPVLVLADVAQVEQVLMNLCVNARDAMPSGGNLTIAIRPLEVTVPRVSVENEVSEGRYAYLEITDTGVGMNAATQARLFEPFFTTKDPGKGTGLGLAMVYGIVKQHDGHVFAYSEPGHGTTFKIYLPWLTSAAAVEEAGAIIAADDAVRGGDETILVAEDEGAVARGVKRTLERQGYTIIPARDGQEAVEVFAEKKDRIDLVMLDAVMPRMGGKEAAARIAALKPGQKFLFTSGYPADKGVANGTFILPPEVHFIQKPYAAADLARAVRKALDSPPAADDAADTGADDGAATS
jgi:PAS domain S-box-containing protein